MRRPTPGQIAGYVATMLRVAIVTAEELAVLASDDDPTVAEAAHAGLVRLARATDALARTELGQRAPHERS